MNNVKRRYKRRLLGLWVSEEEYAAFGQEAKHCGYSLSTMLRLRIFGMVKGLRISRRPSPEMLLLNDVASRLRAIAHDTSRIHSNLDQIANRLAQGNRDLFGLDSGLRSLEGLHPKIRDALERMETIANNKALAHYTHKED